MTSDTLTDCPPGEVVVESLKIEEQRLLANTTVVVILLDVHPVLAIRLFILTDGQTVVVLKMFLHVMNLHGELRVCTGNTQEADLDLGPADHAENSVVVSRVTAELQRLIISHPAF